MSGGGDNFLARWSRRKREVEGAENPPSPLRERIGEGGEPRPQQPLSSPTPDPSPQGGGKKPAERGANDSSPRASPPNSGVPELGMNMPKSETSDFGRGGESAEGTEPLPSLEDMTAESDLSAFLREGVPEALKQAALRRMWSLDPAIRDHVGLVEYAWDFNNPASIPGFGSVAAGTPMAQLAARVMSAGKEADTADAAKGDASQAGPAEASPAASPSSISRSDPSRGGRAPDVKSAKEELPAPGDTSLSGTSDLPGESSAETEKRPAPRHGGAMPR